MGNGRPVWLYLVAATQVDVEIQGPDKQMFRDELLAYVTAAVEAYAKPCAVYVFDKPVDPHELGILVEGGNLVAQHGHCLATVKKDKHHGGLAITVNTKRFTAWLRGGA